MFIIAEEKTYKDGDVIFTEGTSGDWIFIVLSGAVEISKILGGEKITLGLLKPDDLFGEFSFFSGGKREATAKAVGHTVLGILDRDILDHQFNKIHSNIRSVVRNLALRYESLINNIPSFSSERGKDIPKSLSLTFRDPEAFKRAYAGDLSRGGLFIKTKNPLKKGENFNLILHLPDLAAPVQVQSEVVWTRRETEDPVKHPPGMRIKFCESDEGVEIRLREYVQNN